MMVFAALTVLRGIWNITGRVIDRFGTSDYRIRLSASANDAATSG